MIAHYVPDTRTINWNVNANGNWFTASNWTPQNVPGGAGRDASISITFSAIRTITVNDHVTVRNLTIALGSSSAVVFACSAGKKIYFKSISGVCTLTSSGGTNPSFNSSCEIVLLSDFTINNTGRFDWDGLISGSISTFTKSGSALFNLTNTSNSFTALIVVTAGTLTPSSNTCLGDLSNQIELAGGTIDLTSVTTARTVTVSSSSNISTNSSTNLTGSLVLNANITISLGGRLSGTTSGSGNITLTTGTLIISGTHNGTGNISPAFAGRTLIVTGTISNSTGSIGGSFILKGNGSIAKAISVTTAASIEASNGAGTPGTLTLTNGLTMSGATTPDMIVKTSGSTVSKIVVTGNAVLKCNIQFPDSSLTAGTYDILTYTGTLTDNGIALGATNNTGITLTLVVDTINKKIQIIAG
jgi:hypothetical protein